MQEREETTLAGHARSQVEVLVGVRIVKCHAIVDVLCHAVIRVVIGGHVLLLPPLIVVHFVSQFSYCIKFIQLFPVAILFLCFSLYSHGNRGVVFTRPRRLQ